MSRLESVLPACTLCELRGDLHDLWVQDGRLNAAVLEQVEGRLTACARPDVDGRARAVAILLQLHVLLKSGSCISADSYLRCVLWVARSQVPDR